MVPGQAGGLGVTRGAGGASARDAVFSRVLRQAQRFSPRSNLSGPALETVTALGSKIGEDVGNVCQLLIFLRPGLGEPPPAQPAGIRDLSRGPTVREYNGARALPAAPQLAASPHEGQLQAARPGRPAQPRRPSELPAKRGHRGSAATAAATPPTFQRPQRRLLPRIPAPTKESLRPPRGRGEEGARPGASECTFLRRARHRAERRGPRNPRGRRSDPGPTPAGPRPRPAPRPGVPGRAPGFGRTMRRRGRSGGGKRRRR